ncbi:SIR2 family protein [Virgibacillus sp. YIM 98842]|uniref:SIR2 family protein n=1 Tax=Virgibacillus sp. YIM 98842 TaxID=2663533 RepID=UPI0013DBB057|nr:SIR2 family protein [Virgibacillus sp. YIM 98842]
MAVIEREIEKIESSDKTQTKTLYYLREGKDIIENLGFEEQQEKVSALLLRGIQSKNLNIFIGSGCSLPAVELMGSTFKSLKEQNKSLILGSYGGDSADIEGYLNWLNTGIRFIDQNSNPTKLESQKREKLIKSFNVTKEFLVDSIVKDYDKEDKSILSTKNNYQLFYNSIFSIRGIKNYSPVNIYTTNYDLFNEIAMESLNIQYTNGFRGTVNRIFDPAVFQLRLVDDENRYKDKWSVVRKYVKLYKIHGSIDWRYDSKVKNVVQSNLINESLEDVLIYPTINKHIETQQTPYSELFRALTVNLQKPDSTLIIIGYGFPDQHINHLISQSLNNEDFNLIVFGNQTEENAEEFIKQHQHKANFHFIGGSISSADDGHFFSNVINYISGGNLDEE